MHVFFHNEQTLGQFFEPLKYLTHNKSARLMPLLPKLHEMMDFWLQIKLPVSQCHSVGKKQHWKLTAVIYHCHLFLCSFILIIFRLCDALASIPCSLFHSQQPLSVTFSFPLLHYSTSFLLVIPFTQQLLIHNSYRLQTSLLI